MDTAAGTAPTITDEAGERSTYDHDDPRVVRDAAREAMRHFGDLIDVLNRVLGDDGYYEPAPTA